MSFYWDHTISQPDILRALNRLQPTNAMKLYKIIKNAWHKIIIALLQQARNIQNIHDQDSCTLQRANNTSLSRNHMGSLSCREFSMFTSTTLPSPPLIHPPITRQSPQHSNHLHTNMTVALCTYPQIYTEGPSLVLLYSIPSISCLIMRQNIPTILSVHLDRTHA